MSRFLKVMAALMLMTTAVFYPAECLNAQTHNGHDYVDLGLPSGTLWATCNVGATTPEGYGDYFAWGETQPKTTYDWSTYKYANGAKDKLTKYCSSFCYGNNGFTDNLTTLQAGDDPATANWGSGWQTPSEAQWEELKANTASTWTTRNGVSGRLFTASNGNSLFLPAAGIRYSSLYDAGEQGHYWSSSRTSLLSYFACEFNVFWASYLIDDMVDRTGGRSVRAVRSAK